MMYIRIEYTLYFDPQAAPHSDHCPRCGGHRYAPGYHCLRCERRGWA